jgi:hypothetical protein
MLCGELARRARPVLEELARGVVEAQRAPAHVEVEQQRQIEQI